MRAQDPVAGFLEKARGDERILPTHLALFMAILMYSNSGISSKWFRVCRSKLMEFSKLRSKSTYHKCLKNLVDFGYIRYEPSYDPIRASRISIICTELQ